MQICAVVLCTVVLFLMDFKHVILIFLAVPAVGFGTVFVAKKVRGSPRTANDSSSSSSHVPMAQVPVAQQQTCSDMDDGYASAPAGHPAPALEGPHGFYPVEAMDI